MPTSMSTGLQFPSTMAMENLTTMMDSINMVMATIMIPVLATMITTKMKYFNMTMKENNEMETIWTITPFMILTIMIIPSIKCLYMMESCTFCGMNIKISGSQWFWSYSYPNEYKFNSYMEMTKKEQIRLMEVDNKMIIPTETPIQLMVTSTDVIHSWTIPSAGVKTDAIPGRVNQMCMMMKKPGIYYGQCSEICGSNHSFMPITIESVNPKEFVKVI